MVCSIRSVNKIVERQYPCSITCLLFFFCYLVSGFDGTVADAHIRPCICICSANRLERGKMNTVSLGADTKRDSSSRVQCNWTRRRIQGSTVPDSRIGTPTSSANYPQSIHEKVHFGISTPKPPSIRLLHMKKEVFDRLMHVRK